MALKFWIYGKFTVCHQCTWLPEKANTILGCSNGIKLAGMEEVIGIIEVSFLLRKWKC